MGEADKPVGGSSYSFLKSRMSLRFAAVVILFSLFFS